MNNACKNPNCLKIFCRKHNSSETKEAVDDILQNYGDIFRCEKINKWIFNPEKFSCENEIIDLYFYLFDLVYNKGTGKSKKMGVLTEQKDFNTSNNKILKPVSSNPAKRIIKADSRKILPNKDINHNFCKIGKDYLSNTDRYLLTGILHLILAKETSTPNITTALVAIRLFPIVTRHTSIDNKYYFDLLYAYNFICSSDYKFILEPKALKVNYCGENKIPETHYCGENRCLFQSAFTKNDFLNSLRAITELLNLVSSPDIRDNKNTKILLDIHLILYRLNTVFEFVSYEKFYIPKIANLINIKEELKHLKAKKASFLTYQQIFPVAVKAEYLKSSNTDIQKGTLQDSFFRALFEGMTEPYLFITIRRDFIYKDTLRVLKDVPESNLKKQLKISFLNEDGVDSGGMRREYFQLLGHEITHDESIFCFKNERVWLKPEVDLERLGIIGKIIGIALYNDVVLNIPFASIFFKKLLNRGLKFDDLIEIEPEYYNSLKNLDFVDEETLKELELSFVASYEINDKINTNLLIEKGDQIFVDKQNLDFYRTAFAYFYMDKLVLEEFNEILDGFYSVIDSDSISNFHPKELEKIVVGIEEFDFGVIKKTTIYQGYTIEAKVIQDFWKIVENYSLENKKKLLRFVTGNDRIPIGGAESLKFTIMKNGCDTDRLPSSQTCFNTLLLPEYATYQKLQSKLLSAIDMTTGFYLM